MIDQQHFIAFLRRKKVDFFIPFFNGSESKWKIDEKQKMQCAIYQFIAYKNKYLTKWKMWIKLIFFIVWNQSFSPYLQNFHDPPLQHSLSGLYSYKWY